MLSKKCNWIITTTTLTEPYETVGVDAAVQDDAILLESSCRVARLGLQRSQRVHHHRRFCCLHVSLLRRHDQTSEYERSFDSA